MEHILLWLKGHGILDVVVSTSYLGKMVHDYFGDGSDWGMNVVYATSPHPLGTAGQLKAAADKIQGRFVCIYGDALLDCNLGKAVRFHQKKRAMATMVLMKYSAELKYGFMETDREGRLLRWNEKPKYSGYINVGCYIMEKEFLKFIPPGRVYEMNVAFNKAKAAGARVYAVRLAGEFTDIGDRKSYRKANLVYTRRMQKVA
jgi:NDP-sugar pyrophosphorylase family protein